jgi:hypothetical protein
MYDGGNITVWAKAITPYGCVDSVKAVIGEAALEITAVNPPVTCYGESAILTATVSGCTTTAMTYTWDIGGTEHTTTVPTVTTGSLTATTTYTVTVRNAYGEISAVSNTGTISVHDAPTIALTSGSNNQSITGDNSISQIQYTTTNATGVTPSGLPPGVNGGWSAGVYTLSGKPTTDGTYNYTVSTTNNYGCTNAIATGTLCVCKPSYATWNVCEGFTTISTCSNEKCGALTFAAATAACTAHGTGWRLPTSNEFMCICNNKTSVPGGLVGGGKYHTKSDDSQYQREISVGSYCFNSSYNTADPAKLLYVKCVK